MIEIANINAIDGSEKHCIEIHVLINDQNMLLMNLFTAQNGTISSFAFDRLLLPPLDGTHLQMNGPVRYHKSPDKKWGFCKPIANFINDSPFKSSLMIQVSSVSRTKNMKKVLFLFAFVASGLATGSKDNNNNVLFENTNGSGTYIFEDLFDCWYLLNMQTLALIYAEQLQSVFPYEIFRQ